MPKKTTIKRILILEDEATLAQMYADKLIEAGFEVKIFHKTDGLKEECENFKPDIAFVDYTLEGSSDSGTAAIPLVRKCNQEMKVVMLTNYSTSELKKGKKSAEADDFLLKINTPPDVLVAYVKQH